MEAGYKFWIEESGKKIFGNGPMELLIETDKLGSLRKASIQMNMSYSKAWNIIKLLEESTGHDILEKRIGGQQGGGSTLTDEAREIISCYSKFRKEAEEAVKEAFERNFGNI